jgi:hypothetical protein
LERFPETSHSYQIFRLLARIPAYIHLPYRAFEDWLPLPREPDRMIRPQKAQRPE